MFEKFTEGAIKILMAAQEEARRMGHNHVGTEQLMLAIIGQRRGIAGIVLSTQGIKLKSFRREVEKLVGRGRGFLGLEVPFTPRAKRVLELAILEARALDVNYVGSEHLLLAMINSGDGLGMVILDKFKINYSETRRLIFELVGEMDEYPSWDQQAFENERISVEEFMAQGEDGYEYTENIWRNRRKSKKYRAEPQNDEVERIYGNKYRYKLNNDDDEYEEMELEDEGEDYLYDDTLYPQDQNNIRGYVSKRKDNPKPRKKVNKDGSISFAPYVIRAKTKRKAKNILQDFSVNISREAKDKLLDPVIGRDDVIQNLIKVLARRRKNNPVLVGEPGVGKTACAEGLALMMVEPTCPDFLKNYEIYNLDLGSVLAGTKYRGEFEERFKKILQNVQEEGNIILVIDEIHTIVGAGAAEGAVDAANLLKPALARGILKLIGATTIDEYRKHIEKDPALERRFHPITVNEPSVETTIDILKGLKPYYQKHHGLLYDDLALEAAAALTHRFITDRHLPDKAIDVIDECGSQVRLRNRALPEGLQRLVTELHATLNDIEDAIGCQDFNLAKLLIEHELEVRAHMKVLALTMEQHKKYYDKMSTFDRICEKDITDVISAWTGIPVTKINESEMERLKKMESILHERLIGQHHAITAVSKAVRRARTGIQDPKRPIASFIFAGPTGVGKTELTKALAEYIFDTEKNMIRFDMSEFMEKHTASKLIGSPPGYVGHDEGGQLTDAVRRQPYSIILFDEVEKAHPDIFNLFLQILDDGQLSDSKGKVAEFKNCIIVMTTNLGAHVIEQESPILPGTQEESFDLYDETWEDGSNVKKSQKIDLTVNLDGTFTVKAPVEQPITEEDEERFKKINVLVNDELKKFFRPEFLNRVDDIIVFQHLSKHNIWEISGVMLKNLAKRLEFQGVTIEIDNAVRFFLAEQGYDPVYGARPLRRAIIKLLEDELAVACLENPLEKGTHIIVKQELNPSPVRYAEYFNDIYSDKILVTFDKSKVKTDFETNVEEVEELSFM